MTSCRSRSPSKQTIAMYIFVAIFNKSCLHLYLAALGRFFEVKVHDVDKALKVFTWNRWWRDMTHFPKQKTEMHIPYYFYLACLSPTHPPLQCHAVSLLYLLPRLWRDMYTLTQMLQSMPLFYIYTLPQDCIRITFSEHEHDYLTIKLNSGYYDPDDANWWKTDNIYHKDD